MLGPCFTLCPFWFCNPLVGEEGVVVLLFLNVTSLLSSLSFPHDAMGLSVMCDCGISWSDIYFQIHTISLCESYLTYQLSYIYYIEV